METSRRTVTKKNETGLDSSKLFIDDCLSDFSALARQLCKYFKGL